MVIRQAYEYRTRGEEISTSSETIMTMLPTCRCRIFAINRPNNGSEKNLRRNPFWLNNMRPNWLLFCGLVTKLPTEHAVVKSFVGFRFYSFEWNKRLEISA